MPSDTFLLPKRLLESPLWQDAELWRLWCWVRISAARKACTTLCSGVPARLRAGEAAAPAEAILAATGLSFPALRRCLALGKSLGLLESSCSPWAIRIIIVK